MSPPPDLTYVGDIKTDVPRLTVIEFGADHYCEHRHTALPEQWPEASATNVVWINLHGLQDVALLERVAERYGLHPLVIEDILNTKQRPKLEDYPQFVFVVAKLVDLQEGRLEIDQLSLVLTQHVVLTFQERPIGAFTPIRERLHHSRNNIARLGADHLAYLLLDAVMDRYFAVLERLSDHMERLDAKVMFHQEPILLRQIHNLKRQAGQLRRLVWPLRDLMHQLAHHETPLIDNETQLYIRDLQDHVLHILEVLDLLRDQVGGLMDVYMSGLSNRLNQQMRLLTVITTIFMPLTLIAGIYGMNFDFMPELRWKWGYPAVLLLMATLAIGMGWFFRRKRFI